MIKLDIDTILLFKGKVNEEKCICFYGEQESTWSILYRKDLSLIKSQNFYKILNPSESQIILNIYIFNNVKDALAFYNGREATFFANALIVLVDEQSKQEAAQDLRTRFNHFSHEAPKLHFFHRPEMADLYLFYMELLKLNLTYQISNISNGLSLNLKYKSININLSFKELNKLRFFLGINDSTFKIKNKVLSINNTKQLITW